MDLVPQYVLEKLKLAFTISTTLINVKWFTYHVCVFLYVTENYGLRDEEYHDIQLDVLAMTPCNAYKNFDAI